MGERKHSRILHPELSESVDAGKRKIVRALVTGAAFAAPLMASFSKDGLKFKTAEAASRRKAAKKKAAKKKAAKKKAKRKR